MVSRCIIKTNNAQIIEGECLGIDNGFIFVQENGKLKILNAMYLREVNIDGILFNIIFINENENFLIPINLDTYIENVKNIIEFIKNNPNINLEEIKNKVLDKFIYEKEAQLNNLKQENEALKIQLDEALKKIKLFQDTLNELQNKLDNLNKANAILTEQLKKFSSGEIITEPIKEKLNEFKMELEEKENEIIRLKEELEKIKNVPNINLTESQLNILRAIEEYQKKTNVDPFKAIESYIKLVSKASEKQITQDKSKVETTKIQTQEIPQKKDDLFPNIFQTTGKEVQQNIKSEILRQLKNYKEFNLSRNKNLASTGSIKIDMVLKGGIPYGNSIMVSYTPFAGGDLFSLLLIYGGLKSNENVYVILNGISKNDFLVLFNTFKSDLNDEELTRLSIKEIDNIEDIISEASNFVSKNTEDRERFIVYNIDKFLFNGEISKYTSYLNSIKYSIKNTRKLLFIFVTYSKQFDRDIQLLSTYFSALLEFHDQEIGDKIIHTFRVQGIPAEKYKWLSYNIDGIEFDLESPNIRTI
jgi:archaellum biogenesis ATPase FlaH